MEEPVKETKLKYVFEVETIVSQTEIDAERKGNRSSLGTGMNKKDINVAMQIGYRKALELITKQSSAVETKVSSMLPTDINFNLK